MARNSSDFGKQGATGLKGARTNSLPKVGDSFRCESCGMELDITTDCGCDNPDQVRFECCGEEMTKA